MARTPAARMVGEKVHGEDEGQSSTFLHPVNKLQLGKRVAKDPRLQNGYLFTCLGDSLRIVGG